MVYTRWVVFRMERRSRIWVIFDLFGWMVASLTKLEKSERGAGLGRAGGGRNQDLCCPLLKTFLYINCPNI